MPAHLGTYVIRERLAAGGMGAVDLADDLRPHRPTPVAVKVIRPRLLVDPGQADSVNGVDPGVASLSSGPYSYFWIPSIAYL